jgi:adenylosuccinate synthase
LGDAKFGSTRRGISPVYADKYMKKTFRMGDLLDMESVKRRIDGIVEWKNLTVEKGYGSEPITSADMIAWLEKYGLPFADYICDTTEYLSEAADSGKSIMFEAQLGALRDIDFGIIPYTSASYTIASYAPIGAGIPGRKLDSVLGIMKAYSSCVGEGPFTCELFGNAGNELREAGGEYGAATGRPRRVGGFDVVASRYGTQMQGATSIALTKMDVLTGMEKVPVCVAYRVNGEVIHTFPSGERLAHAEPVYDYLEGWTEDISLCRSFDELPKAAQDYVRYIEKSVGCPIQYISVGAGREEYIKVY